MINHISIKHLINYNVSLIIQGLISVVFLYFFYRINKTIPVLEAELIQQTTTSQKLNQIVDSIEKQIRINTTVKVDEDKQSDTLGKHRIVSQKSPTKNPIEAKAIERNATKPPIISTSPAREEIKKYEYEYKDELALNNSKIIIAIQGTLFVTYDLQQKPQKCTAEIEMRQIDERIKGPAQTVTFRLASCELRGTNFRCIFQENPLPAANEFEALTQRKLAVALTGSLETLGMNGQLEWNEVTGQPMNRWIKMTLKKIN